MNKNTIKTSVITIIIVVTITIVKLFVIDVARVDGNSMNPTLKNNDFLIFSKINNKYKRFDIVILKVNSKYFIKRIIGLEGEKIKYIDNKLFINEELVNEDFVLSNTSDFSLKEISPYDIIPNDMFLVLGDNREDSYDSRNYGLISINDIGGKILFK
ncbi:MAG: signal peptidase I [Bacilli bacterium]